VLAAVLLAFFAGIAGAVEEFPLRAKYPKLTPISTDDLVAVFGKAIIVDSRNESEYDVVHIKNAKNILVGKMKEENLTALRGKSDAALLVFYCNGINCAKSYKAAEKAEGWGFANVRVYDAGIFIWAEKQPERSLFFGKQLTAETVKTALLSDAKFNAVLLKTADFIAKAKSDQYTVIDIRDPNERSEQPIRLPKLKVLAFDLMVSLLEKKSDAVPRSGLLILDNVGKQVDWLQYYLEKEGIKNYYFLSGGVAQWIKDGYDPAGVKK
jgi:rhodanese-related sulfurtransferase